MDGPAAPAPAAPGPPRVPPAPRTDGSAGLRVLTVSGIPVYVAPSSLLFVVVITLLNAPAIGDRFPSLGGAAYAVAALFVLLLYASILLHELAHSLVAQRLGLAVHRIKLDLLGGFSETSLSRTAGSEALVAVVGPLVNLALFAAGLAAIQVVSGDTVPGALLRWVTMANLLIGIFNLLPGIPLDGGRVLAAGVWRATSNRSRGVIVASYAGRGLAVLVLAFVLSPILLGGRRPEVFSLIVGALIAAFLWQGASGSLLVARARERIPDLVAGRLARRALMVPARTPLAEAMRLLREGGAAEIVVVDGDGGPVGIVNSAAAAAVPVDRQPWVDVATVAARLGDGGVLPTALAGDELIAALRGSPSDAYVVVGPGSEGTRVVQGVLLAADVDAALTATRGTRRPG
jgi:Zn-dependent protease